MSNDFTVTVPSFPLQYIPMVTRKSTSDLSREQRAVNLTYILPFQRLSGTVADIEFIQQSIAYHPQHHPRRCHCDLAKHRIDRFQPQSQTRFESLSRFHDAQVGMTAVYLIHRQSGPRCLFYRSPSPQYKCTTVLSGAVLSTLWAPCRRLLPPMLSVSSPCR